MSWNTKTWPLRSYYPLDVCVVHRYPHHYPGTRCQWLGYRLVLAIWAKENAHAPCPATNDSGASEFQTSEASRKFEKRASIPRPVDISVLRRNRMVTKNT